MDADSGGNAHLIWKGKCADFCNTGIKMEVIDEIISFVKKYNIHRVIMSF